ncbi:MAG: tetratricopeptide repeat protein [gamma proteobacterium endosymbiont of Lamellibrachia anaximandri]|nr:tetratricopeptide repeat protein [gamma proteobacterium endosymbiont of Lamellibrachia anaximandri]MBL3618353.1 tetratricopeptide repeat protein [gamma proteobacterium endosymbiont of Lamellibrachia anaximandri]
MQVLVYLAAHAGRVISRAELEENIWQGRIVGEDALTNTISKLRRTFGDDARNPKTIETLPKTGYRLVAEVNWIDAESEPPAKRSFRAERPNSLPGRFWMGLLVSMALLTGIAGWLLLQQQAGSDLEISIQSDGSEGKPSVAIIPFENLGEKPQQDYFANGITANLITDLSKVSGLLVIAPGSVFPYRNSTFGTRKISQELNVDYVVRGSVQRQGHNVRVNAQLIEAASERALWAERYDSEMSNVFKLQDQVATALVAALSVELAPSERDIFSRDPSASVQAYDLFLRGLEEYGHRTPGSNRSARGYFEQAIALDPNFTRATAGLALVHSRDAIDGWTATPTHSLSLAAKFADTAADINPTVPQVHFVTGQVALFRGQHAKAIEATQRAIDYSPNYADAYALLAWIMSYAGQPNEALAVLESAIRLNPVIPASYSEILGEILFLQGNYSNAIASFERALQINPSHMRARMWLIVTLAQLGKLDEVQWQVAELMLLNSGFSLARLEYAFPFRDQSVRNRLLQGLRQAGLPE